MFDQPCRSMTPSGLSFDEAVLPHLDAATRLARWLVRNEHDADDVVQEASLRAFRYFRTFTGGDARAWFLRIVRNTCCGRRSPSFRVPADPLDEQERDFASIADDPEALCLQADEADTIGRAMSHVPDRFRELLVLRAYEGLSYRELADMQGVPIGTVMSSLSRARQALRHALDDERLPSRRGVRTPRPTEAARATESARPTEATS